MDFKNECQGVLDHYLACYRAKDAAGCAGSYSVDAELYSPYGPPAIGRIAIEASHREWLAEDGSGSNKVIEVVSAGLSGDIGWCLAHYSDGPEENGTSLNVLERQADGTWLIRQCSLNELD
ncbi:MAG: nuclear transport factor 2 family protein [Rhizobiaceae bacterium]